MNADFAKLVKACNKRTAAGLRDLAVLRVLDSCGLRGSELTHLTLDDLHLEDADKAHIIVRAGKGDKDKFAPIDKAGAAALLRYLAKGRPALYAEVPHKHCYARQWAKRKADATRVFPYTRQRIFQIIRDLCRRANIAPLHPHQLRHRLGSWLVSHGLELREVADILGHSSTDTTRDLRGSRFQLFARSVPTNSPKDGPP